VQKGFMFDICPPILLSFSLTMVMKPDWFGISDGLIASEFLLTVGIWWIWFCTSHFYYFT
jgi:UMF1 family MFS transporter